MAVTRKMSLQLRERDPYCIHCGADDTLQTHHRQNRGMGGSKKLDRLDNLIRICAWLNYMMEQDADVAAEARSMGWKLGSWDGFDTPVFDKTMQAWFILTADGRKVPSTPPMYLI